MTEDHLLNNSRDDIQEEVDFEPEDEMGDVGAAKAKIAKLRAELKEAQAKRDQHLAGWQREKADAINARKDADVRAQRAIERAEDSYIEELIPVLDSFDMAKMGPAWEGVSPDWQKGMGHIQNQLLEVLSRRGVERYGKSGEVFDPQYHEALQEVDDGSGESHTILTVVRHGYSVKSNGGTRVIRPAQVIIRK